MQLQLMKIRESKQLTRGKLGERAGLSREYINQLENGQKSPTLRTLEKLAVALGVSVIDLISEEKETSA